MAGQILYTLGEHLGPPLVRSGNRLIVPRLGNGLLTAVGDGIAAIRARTLQDDNVALSDHFVQMYTGLTASGDVDRETFSAGEDYLFHKDFVLQHGILRSEASYSDYRTARSNARAEMLTKLQSVPYPGPETYIYSEFPEPMSIESDSNKEISLTTPHIFYGDGPYTRGDADIGGGQGQFQFSADRLGSCIIAYPGADPGARVHATVKLGSAAGDEVVSVLYQDYYSGSAYNVNPFIDIYAAAGEWTNKWPTVGEDGVTHPFVSHETVNLGTVGLLKTKNGNRNYYVVPAANRVFDVVFTVPKSRAALITAGIVRDFRTFIDDLIGSPYYSYGYPIYSEVICTKTEFNITINRIGD